jgi:hypothetical protein
MSVLRAMQGGLSDGETSACTHGTVIKEEHE